MKEWFKRYYYILRNKTSGKQYIGQRVKDDVGSGYLGSGVYWKRHNKKHGGHTSENIEVVYCERYDNKQDAELFLEGFEFLYPDYWEGPLNKKLWANSVRESTGKDKKPSTELKKRISESMKNHPDVISGLHGQRVRDALTGRKLSEAVRKAIGDALRGTTLSEEHKQSISLTLQGHEVTQETREKLSKINQARFEDPEERARTSRTTKKAMRDPSLRKHLSKVQKARMRDEQTRQDLSTKVRKTCSDKAWKKEHIKKILNGMNNEATKKKLAQGGKKAWEGELRDLQIKKREQRLQCQVTGQITTKAHFTRQAKAMGLPEWPHELKEIQTRIEFDGQTFERAKDLYAYLVKSLKFDVQTSRVTFLRKFRENYSIEDCMISKRPRKER